MIDHDSNMFLGYHCEHLWPAQVSHLIMHRECRHDQEVLKVFCEKALENEHFAKVPVQRVLGSSGYITCYHNFIRFYKISVITITMSMTCDHYNKLSDIIRTLQLSNPYPTIITKYHIITTGCPPPAISLFINHYNPHYL